MFNGLIPFKIEDLEPLGKQLKDILQKAEEEKLDSFVMKTLKQTLDEFELTKKCRDFEIKGN